MRKVNRALLHVFLNLAYFIAVPFVVVYRLFHDPLHRKLDPDASSYFIRHTTGERSKV
ncbi:hypothetical protein ACTWP5_30010 [Streptomyces sp. 4N509B]|uniref:hypothetical protein n=1 Tax=Streptomyces sp. 4N509B TaxID=3457413 RepID=UPI003FD0E070